MSARTTFALAAAASLALHLALVVAVPGMRVRLPAGLERLVEVELSPSAPVAEPEPLKAPEPPRPPVPERPAPLSPDERASLERALGPVAPAAPGPTPPTSPVRLPRRTATLPEADALPWRPLAPATPALSEAPPTPLRPDAQPLPTPEKGGAAEVARALLQTAVSPVTPGPDAEAQEVMRRLEIEGPVGADRRVVEEPPPPRVPIRNPATVAIRFFVSPRGAVTRAIPIERGDPELDRAAVAYIRAFRFNPLPPGEEKEQWGTIRVRIRLQ